MPVPRNWRGQLVDISVEPPPCCIFNTILKCIGCGWRVCEGHWYDESDITIWDKFHVPSKNDFDNIGICLRCKGEAWVKYGADEESSVPD